MFREIIHLTSERGSVCLEALSRLLDTSPELVRMALSELGKHGYLRLMAPSSCTNSVGPCPVHPARSPCRQPSIWMLTHKGERLLAEEQRGTGALKAGSVS